MGLTTRIRVRTLMALIALVAVGIGAVFELKNHAARDHLLRAQARRYERAAWHWKLGLECKLAVGSQRPYRSAERLKLLSEGHWYGMFPPGGFRSWEEEFDSHMYCAQRDNDTADYWNEKLESVEASLLFLRTD